MFVYCSTCYCQIKEKIVFEKSYPPPRDPHEIIKLVEENSLEEVENQRKEIIGSYPNSYAFSKALSEGLVSEARDKKGLKALLVRPSIVIQIYKDPFPGTLSIYVFLNQLTYIFFRLGKQKVKFICRIKSLCIESILDQQFKWSNRYCSCNRTGCIKNGLHY